MLRKKVEAVAPHVAALVGIAVILFMVLKPSRPGPTSTVVRVDTVEGTQWKARLDSTARELANVRGQNGRLAKLNSMLRGEVERKPASITFYDTIIPPPDTIMLPSSISADGHLDLARGVKDSTGYRPSIERGIDVRDCDDGLAFGGTGVVCNRALLGHLSVIARPSLSGGLRGDSLEFNAFAGLHWQHTFRSTSSAEALIDIRRRITLQGTFGFRIF